MYKNFYSPILFLFIITSFLSCGKEEEAPSNSVPNIEFVSIEYIEKSTDHVFPSIAVTIKVEDKEMDLGLDQYEKENDEFNPFVVDPVTKDTVANPYYFNLWATLLRKQDNVFTLVTTPTLYDLYGRFPRISGDEYLYSYWKWSKKGKNSGHLIYYFRITTGFKVLAQSKPIKFEIEIIDRAKNHSNKIETAEILIPN